MERLKHLKESLMCVVEGQMGNLQAVDTKELGEAIDMIKDLEEAMYYCTITKAMEKKDGEEQHYQRYYPYPYYDYPERDMDRRDGRMYYSSPTGNSSAGMSNSQSNNMGDNSSKNYEEREYPMEMRDYREGRSPKSRRMYMEAKEAHSDKMTQQRELEKYMYELSQDITEMIADASAEEKQYLEKKLASLATKVNQLK